MTIKSEFENYRREVLLTTPENSKKEECCFFAGATAALQILVMSESQPEAVKNVLKQVMAHADEMRLPPIQ